jgi:hypothetical protein
MAEKEHSGTFEHEAPEPGPEFFDSQRHVTVDDLIYDDGKWIWAGERIRMDVTLKKVE